MPNAIRCPSGDQIGEWLSVADRVNVNRVFVPFARSRSQRSPSEFRALSREMMRVPSGESASWTNSPGEPTVPSALPSRANQFRTRPAARPPVRNASAPVLDADTAMY